MSSPRAGKRRVDTDVIKLIESKHEVRDISGIKDENWENWVDDKRIFVILSFNPPIIP